MMEQCERSVYALNCKQNISGGAISFYDEQCERSVYALNCKENISGGAISFYDE